MGNFENEKNLNYNLVNHGKELPYICKYRPRDVNDDWPANSNYMGDCIQA